MFFLVFFGRHCVVFGACIDHMCLGCFLLLDLVDTRREKSHHPTKLVVGDTQVGPILKPVVGGDASWGMIEASMHLFRIVQLGWGAGLGAGFFCIGG